jgi:hypothetical protein
MTIALLFIINRSNATTAFLNVNCFVTKRENLFYHKITLHDALIFGRC